VTVTGRSKPLAWCQTQRERLGCELGIGWLVHRRRDCWARASSPVFLPLHPPPLPQPSQHHSRNCAISYIYFCPLYLGKITHWYIYHDCYELFVEVEDLNCIVNAFVKFQIFYHSGNQPFFFVRLPPTPKVISLQLCTPPPKKKNCCIIKVILSLRGSVVIKALCYNPEGSGFDTRPDE
jgi:hypothetical protein